MRRRTAQQICPELVLADRDEGRDVRAFEPVVQALEDVVSHVQVLRPGVIVIPAGGPARFFGAEETLAAELIGAVAQVAGVEAQVGLADGLLAALLAARSSALVPVGGGADYLAGRDVRDLLYLATTRSASAQVVDLADCCGGWAWAREEEWPECGAGRRGSRSGRLVQLCKCSAG